MKEQSFSNSSWTFDLPFIRRVLRKWLFVALCTAVIFCVLALVYKDRKVHDVYTATALVTVAARDNNASYLTDYYLNSAITRNVSMWNSNALRKAIQAANPDVKINGSLKATALTNNGLVRLVATSTTAKDAFFLLSEAVNNYRSISANFDTDYRTVVLTTVNADCVKVTHSSIILYGAVGFIAGLALVLGLAFIWAIATDILHNESQARNLMDVPVLGHLVKVKRRHGDKNLLLDRSRLPVEFLEELNVITSQVERTLRSENKKILMVTSVFQNDGKSSTAANIALTLAKRDRKVLLMEMDLRNPSVYELFGHEKMPGRSWTHAFARGLTLQQYIETSNENENLDVLYQFQNIKDADSFLENSDLDDVLQQLSEGYDYVLLDTPPMWGVRDPEVIASIADASILLIRQDKCHARTANDMLDKLETCGAPCLGVVLNHCRGIYARSHVNEAYGYLQFYRGAQKR